MGKAKHEQVCTKVNAYVDEGVTDLVTALSGFEGVQTIESCQGEPKEAAWVCFVMGEDEGWRELADFLFEFLGPRLAAKFGDGVHVSMDVRDTGLTMGHLTVRSGWMEDTVLLLNELSKEWC